MSQHSLEEIFHSSAGKNMPSGLGLVATADSPFVVDVGVILEDVTSRSIMALNTSSSAVSTACYLSKRSRLGVNDGRLI